MTPPDPRTAPQPVSLFGLIENDENHTAVCQDDGRLCGIALTASNRGSQGLIEVEYPACKKPPYMPTDNRTGTRITADDFCAISLGDNHCGLSNQKR